MVFNKKAIVMILIFGLTIPAVRATDPVPTKQHIHTLLKAIKEKSAKFKERLKEYRTEYVNAIKEKSAKLKDHLKEYRTEYVNAIKEKSAKLKEHLKEYKDEYRNGLIASGITLFLLYILINRNRHTHYRNRHTHQNHPVVPQPQPMQPGSLYPTLASRIHTRDNQKTLESPRLYPDATLSHQGITAPSDHSHTPYRDAIQHIYSNGNNA